jgi:hypothetical protein
MTWFRAKPLASSPDHQKAVLFMLLFSLRMQVKVPTPAMKEPRNTKQST